MSLFVYLVALAFFVGAFLVFRGHKTKLKRAAAWPTAPGTVRTSEVARSRTVSHDHRTHRRRTTTTVYPNVVYAYTVDGVEHVGERVRFGSVRGDVASQHVVNTYPVGSTPAVHYNPEKPGEAVLELTGGGGTGCLFWALIAMGVFVGLVGMMIGSVENAIKNAPPYSPPAASTAPAASDSLAMSPEPSPPADVGTTSNPLDD